MENFLGGQISGKLNPLFKKRNIKLILEQFLRNENESNT